jgi:DNA-binding YbaB/EbfC family protein
VDTPKKRSIVSSRGGGYRPAGGGQPNMQQLMKQAQKMQQEMEVAQAEVLAAEFTGTAGGELVTVTMAGSGQVNAIVISPAAVDPYDIETLQDLIVAALRDARRQLDSLTEAKMGPLTNGMGLPGL